jgi:hypothetical protein
MEIKNKNYAKQLELAKEEASANNKILEQTKSSFDLIKRYTNEIATQIKTLEK